MLWRGDILEAGGQLRNSSDHPFVKWGMMAAGNTTQWEKTKKKWNFLELKIDENIKLKRSTKYKMEWMKKRTTPTYHCQK